MWIVTYRPIERFTGATIGISIAIDLAIVTCINTYRPTKRFTGATLLVLRALSIKWEIPLTERLGVLTVARFDRFLVTPIAVRLAEIDRPDLSRTCAKTASNTVRLRAESR